MANPAVNITIRMDAELKTQAEALFDELGLSLSAAFGIFVRQAIREGRIPFEISLHPARALPGGKTAGSPAGDEAR